MMLIGATTLAQPASTPSPSPVAPRAPARPLLYYFEHFALREAAFQYDQDIQALIGSPRQASEPVARLFAKASFRAVREPNFSTETSADDVRAFMRQIGFDTFRSGGYTLHLIQTPPPEYPPETYFVVIVYKDDEFLAEGLPAPSTRYLTFEKTSVEGRAIALGEWDVNGQHKVHGFGNREPTAADVIANTRALLGIKEP